MLLVYLFRLCAAATTSIAVPTATPAMFPVELVHLASFLYLGLRRQKPVLWFLLFVLEVLLNVRLVAPVADSPLANGAAALFLW